VESFGIFKYKEKWLLSSEGLIEDGPVIQIGPVRVVDLEDAKRLQQVIVELLTETRPLVPEPDYTSTDWKRSIFAMALGLRTWRAFAKDAECFALQMSGKFISIEKWRRGPMDTFVGPPVWRKSFRRHDLHKLVTFLIEKTGKRSRKRKR